MRQSQGLKIAGVTAALSVLAIACSDNYKLTPSPAPVNAATAVTGGGTSSPGGSQTSGTCTLTNVELPVKIMFVVDTSGSNNSPSMDEGTELCVPQYETCAPATDPTKSFRSGSITNFFTKYQSKTNFSWGFITFSNGNAASFVGSSSAPTFSNAAAMQSAISQFNSETDNGDTPYMAALSQVQLAISNDPGLKVTGAQAPLYYVIFLSDGYPTDALNADGSVDQAALGSQIQSVKALAPGRVTFSTVYYGTINDANAAGTLQNMAAGGQFVNVDTSSTSTINIQDLIQVPVGQCM